MICTDFAKCLDKNGSKALQYSHTRSIPSLRLSHTTYKPIFLWRKQMAPDELQEKGLAELRTMAKALGVKNVGKYRKNELIEMLSGKSETPSEARRPGGPKGGAGGGEACPGSACPASGQTSPQGEERPAAEAAPGEGQGSRPGEAPGARPGSPQGGGEGGGRGEGPSPERTRPIQSLSEERQPPLQQLYQRRAPLYEPKRPGAAGQPPRRPRQSPRQRGGGEALL